MHRVPLSFAILSLAGMVLGIALWGWNHSPPTARAELGFGSADATTFEPSELPSAPALLTSVQPAMSDPDAESPAPYPAAMTGAETP